MLLNYFYFVSVLTTATIRQRGQVCPAAAAAMAQDSSQSPGPNQAIRLALTLAGAHFPALTSSRTTLAARTLDPL